MADLVDIVINIAAALIRDKTEKKISKQKKKDGKLSSLESSKSFNIADEIEEGKGSSLFKSSSPIRDVDRRYGVVAKNEIEKALVKETIALLMTKNRMKEYFL